MEKHHSESLHEVSLEMKDWFCDDIRLTHSKSKFRDYSIHNGHSDADVFRLHFGMKGNYNVCYKQIGKSFELIGGHHNMLYSKEFDMEFFNKTLGIETFGIQFPIEKFFRFTENANDDLKRFSEKISNGESVIFSDTWGTIDISIQQVIRQIIESNYEEGLQKMFLLSKSIELLVLSTQAYLNSKPVSKTYIRNNSDKEKIIAARDLINNQLTNPPNLSQISKIIGLNEYKLKHGFKEIFKTTVFNYLTEQRLNLAFKNVRDTQKTVAEIAFEMGYSTPQHFNNSFKKKFGITPNNVRKNP